MGPLSASSCYELIDDNMTLNLPIFVANVSIAVLISLLIYFNLDFTFTHYYTTKNLVYEKNITIHIVKLTYSDFILCCCLRLLRTNLIVKLSEV